MVRFPLLLIPLAIYNIIVWLMPTSPSPIRCAKLTLVSGAEWAITLGDILLALSVVLLLLEVMKGARPGAKFLTDHLLSLVVFGAAAAEFVLLRKFGNSIFFLLTLLTLVEFLSGISLHTRRGRVARQAAPVVVESGATSWPTVESADQSRAEADRRAKPDDHLARLAAELGLVHGARQILISRSSDACTGRSRGRCADACCRPTAHPRTLRAEGCGFAAPARRSRSAA